MEAGLKLTEGLDGELEDSLVVGVGVEVAVSVGDKRRVGVKVGTTEGEKVGVYEGLKAAVGVGIGELVVGDIPFSPGKL